MEYIILIHNNAESAAPQSAWNEFFELAMESGMFRGGSEIAACELLGPQPAVEVAPALGGFMRFDAESKDELLGLLRQHPVVQHGGTIELCEMPKSS